MFGLFRKKPSFQPASELVYATSEARCLGLAEKHLPARKRVVLVSPFLQHAVRLQEGLRQQGVATALHGASYREAAPDEGAIPLWTLEQFLTLARPFAGKDPLEVIQVERHPLRKHDDAILPVLASLPQGTRLRVLHALDDGIFQLFGGSIDRVLKQLGLGPNESLEHPLIQKSINNAQERLARKIREEIPADSFASWRAHNLRAQGL